MPIIEAQACGCPVVTTNRPPMTDAAGDAGIFIDISNPDLAAASIAFRWHERETLVMRGYANLQRYSEDDLINRYLDLYSRAASERS